jgi:hypothetical protein
LARSSIQELISSIIAIWNITHAPGPCKVVIKNDSITIYATKELSQKITLTKEGEIIDRGIILKHKSGKWIIGKNRKDIDAKRIGVEGPAILDFRKKQYWTF